MEVFVAIAICYSLFLLVWTLINYSADKSRAEGQRLSQKESREKRENFRYITGITVVTTEGPDRVFTNAKSYARGEGFITVYNEEDRTVAHLERRSVTGVFIDRKGD